MAAKYVPTRRLRIGDRGGDVERLQVAINLRLKRKGRSERVKVDGVYGPHTHTLFGRVCFLIGLNHRKPTVAHQGLVRWPWLRTPAMKKKEQARRPKRPRAGQLTANFHVSEFNCKDGTPVPPYMHDDLKVWCQKYGEPLRKKYGPAVINSGYRHRAYNARIGGEDNSFHIYDVRKSQPAGDVRFGRGTPTAWGSSAKSFRGRSGGGVGIYPRSGFIHIDTRTYQSNWWG